MSSIQRTRLAGFRTVGRWDSAVWSGPWWRRSASLLLLLFGFFIGSNLPVYILNAVELRTTQRSMPSSPVN